MIDQPRTHGPPDAPHFLQAPPDLRRTTPPAKYTDQRGAQPDSIVAAGHSVATLKQHPDSTGPNRPNQDGRRRAEPPRVQRRLGSLVSAVTTAGF